MKHDILLPGTDLYVSPMALGTVNAGLDWDGEDADAIFNYYVDHGGNIIDSARVYFDWAGTEIGRSERVIGDWLRRSGRRDEIVLITKGGHPSKDAMDISRTSQEDMEYDLNLSLNSLGVDYIDIYFYHRDNEDLPVGELLDRMEGFRKEGKIRYYGCSNWTTERMMEADAYAAKHALRGFVSNQNLYNIGTKYMKPFGDSTMVTVDAPAITYFENSNNTPMPYFGICSAFFHILESNGPEAVKDSCYYTEGNLKVAKQIKALCEKYNCTITQVLLGFFYTQDFLTIPLVGFATIDQLDEAMKSVDVPFTKDDFKDMRLENIK